MKTHHIFWGIFFISIGLLWLLNHFMQINYEWDYIWKLWPLVLILWGVVIMVKHPLVKAIITGVAGFLLALAIFTTFKFGFDFSGHNIDWSFNDHNMDYKYGVSEYSEPYSNQYSNASFHFKAGAGTFIIQDTTNDLFHAHAEGRKDNYSLSKSNTDNKVDVNFEMTGKHLSFFHGSNRNRVELKLNTEPLWDLDFDLGAASINLDLSPYKIEKIALDMGAASLKLKLGDRAETTRLDINAGASGIEINVPEDAGCEITTDASLSSKHFEGFKNFNDETYKTDNFDSAKKKIYISIDAGVSSIKVNRYSRTL